MNRKQKIIISVTGIFVVLLILVGLTYAYFLTRINGNTNTKSISVSTKYLELTYSDGNGTITANSISPGTTLNNKTFTVTNTGEEETDYVVVLDNVNITYTSGGTTTFESNDFVYTLTCTASSGECESITDETTLPLVNNGILLGNKIGIGVTQSYTLTITYKETGLDQSNDMNKKIDMRVNISDIKSINPYSSNTNLLAYNIINNSIQNKNGTELRSVPLTKPGREASLENEKELSITPDDYGTSYYYRGTVEDNYVNFANKCWRIVRIEGDGAIKLILDDKNTTCNSEIYTGDWTYDKVNFGYQQLDNQRTIENYLESDETMSLSMAHSFKNFQNTINNKLTLLRVGNYCYNNVAYLAENNKKILSYSELINYINNNKEIIYDTYKRFYVDDKTISMKCNGIIMSKFDNETRMFVGTLTVDEILFAGSFINYELDFDTQHSTYLNTVYNSWWTLSLRGVDSYGISMAFENAGYYGIVSNDLNTNDDYYRPSVVLKKDTIVSSGEGTKTNPYVIN